MIDTLAVHGYRSLRDVVLPLAELTTVTGANGSGKSNLYRAFHLLADTATGRLIGSLAAAGEPVRCCGPGQNRSPGRCGAVKCRFRAPDGGWRPSACNWGSPPTSSGT